MGCNILSAFTPQTHAPIGWDRKLSHLIKDCEDCRFKSQSVVEMQKS
jgi:hypothetical protein